MNTIPFTGQSRLKWARRGTAPECGWIEKRRGDECLWSKSRDAQRTEPLEAAMSMSR